MLSVSRRLLSGALGRGNAWTAVEVRAFLEIAAFVCVPHLAAVLPIAGFLITAIYMYYIVGWCSRSIEGVIVRDCNLHFLPEDKSHPSPWLGRVNSSRCWPDCTRLYHSCVGPLPRVSPVMR